MTVLTYDFTVFPELTSFFEEQRTELEQQSRYVREHCMLDGELGLALSFMKDTYNQCRDSAIQAFDGASEIAGTLSSKLSQYHAEITEYERKRAEDIENIRKTVPGITITIGDGSQGTGGSRTSTISVDSGGSIPQSPTVTNGTGGTASFEFEWKPSANAVPGIGAEAGVNLEPGAVPGAGSGFEWNPDVNNGFDSNGNWVGPGGFGPDGNWYGSGGFGPDGVWHGPGAMGADGNWYGPGGVGPDGTWQGEGGFASDGNWYGPKGIGPGGLWYGPGPTNADGGFMGPEGAGAEGVVEGAPETTVTDTAGTSEPSKATLSASSGGMKLTAELSFGPNGGAKLSVELMSGNDRVAHAQDSYGLDRADMWQERAENDPLGRSPEQLAQAWADRERFTPSSCEPAISWSNSPNAADIFSVWGMTTSSIANLKSVRN